MVRRIVKRFSELRIWSGGVSHVAALTLLLSLSACLVGPDFVKPDAPIADKFLKATSSAMSESRDYRDWWKSFNDPVLNRLIELAYAQNLTLLSAGTRVIEARAALGIAVGEFYPQSQEAVGGLGYSGQSRKDPLD